MPGNDIINENGGIDSGVQLWGPTKNTKPPPDFRAAAEETGAANRPNQTNAFGSTNQWTVGPDGRPQLTQGFGGPLGDASAGLQGQAASNMANPFDFSSLGTLGTGGEARQQAIDSAYSQAASRLDPRFQREEDALRTRLANQGLDPDSEAGRNELSQFSQGKNDAYTSALASAVQQGTAAGDSVFRNNLAARGQQLSEGLLGRSLPMQELLQMRGLLDQPGFNAGPNYLAALGLQTQYDQGEIDRNREQMNDTLGGIMSLLGSATGFL